MRKDGKGDWRGVMFISVLWFCGNLSRSCSLSVFSEIGSFTSVSELYKFFMI